MESAKVLEEVLVGQAKPGWAIYKYSSKEAVKSLSFRIFYLLLFGGVAVAFILMASTYGSTNYIFAGVFGLIVLYLIISIIGFARGILHSNRSMIVFTDKEVIKSLNGMVKGYPYDIIKSPKITNPLAANLPPLARRPEQFIDFTDGRTGQMVELAHNRQFGPPEPIFNFLNSKLI